MVKAIFDELTQPKPKSHFTIGIQDDVSHTSLEWDRDFSILPDDVVQAVFYGLGSDGTVGANKNSNKIIGEETEQHTQGYFVYDSKKAGAVTVSHLRFGNGRFKPPTSFNRPDSWPATNLVSWNGTMFYG
jgi:pyruvate-ferredoxin/flavodoxin oxidoreductase